MPPTKRDKARLAAVAAILEAYPPGNFLPYPAQVARDPRQARHYSGTHDGFDFVGRQYLSPHSEAVFLPRSEFSKYFNSHNLSAHGLRVYRSATNSEWEQLLRSLPRLVR